MRFLILLAVLSLCLPQVVAQTEKPPGEFVTVDFKRSPMREALRAVFRQMSVSYTIDPALEDKPVTMTLERRRYTHVLREIMLQVGGIYEVEGGLFMFRPMRKHFPPAGTIFYSGGNPNGEGAVIGPTKGQGPHDFISYRHADVQLVLKELFMQAGFSYSIDPKLDGIVALELKKVTFDEALGVVLKQVDGAWRIEGGKYVIVRVLTAPG
jgi:type II secretory pathway component GspD/PulD (secretin)